MKVIPDVYVEFSGDPTGDKECYKRYTSTEPFEPVGLDAEVIHFVNSGEIDRLRKALAKVVANGKGGRIIESAGIARAALGEDEDET